MSSVAHIWRDRVASTPSKLAFEFRRHGVWTTLTWRQADERVRAIAAGLLALGVEQGARIAILSRTRVEWILCDFAILCAGAATSTIYPSSTPDECAFILDDAGCWAVFVEDVEQLDKLQGREHVRHLVLIDPTDASLGGRVTSLEQLEALGARFLDEHPGAVDDRIDALGPEDLATLIYTSGTTGRPKGVVLVHDNWVYQAEAVEQDLGEHMIDGDKQYLFLPLAHAFGKICELIAVSAGAPTAIEGDIDLLLDGIQHTRPTLMAAVPRVFEKIYNRILNRAKEAGPRRYAVFRWACRVGDEVARRRLAGERVGARLGLQMAVADRLVFQKLRDALGGRIRAFVSGGAPLSPDIARFFYAAGMVVLEGYGMTETSAGAVANRLDDFRFGTVGKPFPGCEVRIADDGEIWMRGRNVMRGYWNRPDATAEALDPGGWMRSGDLGQLDAEGRLTVTGRKKDLIITAGGKNIAPQNVENRVKAACPYVAEIVMHGDRRPYCVALVWLDPEAVAGVAERELEALSAHPRIVELVQASIDQVNAELASYETIKKVLILDHEITLESGLLTPSMKVKRAIVERRYAERLDACYEGTLASL